MNSYIQLLVIVYSFCYGFFIYKLNKIQMNILLNKNIFNKVLIMFLYCNIIALLYVLILIKINNGILHLYFIMSLIIGYLVASRKRQGS